jgi:hypothetical protein
MLRRYFGEEMTQCSYCGADILVNGWKYCSPECRVAAQHCYRPAFDKFRSELRNIRKLAKYNTCKMSAEVIGISYTKMRQFSRMFGIEYKTNFKAYI